MVLLTLLFSLAQVEPPYPGYPPGNDINCNFYAPEGCVFYVPDHPDFGPEFEFPSRLVVDSGPYAGEYTTNAYWRLAVWFEEFTWGLALVPQCNIPCPPGAPSGLCTDGYVLGVFDCAWNGNTYAGRRISPEVDVSELVYKVALTQVFCSFDGQLYDTLGHRDFVAAVRLGSAPTSTTTANNTLATFIGTVDLYNCDICALYNIGCNEYEGEGEEEGDPFPEGEGEGDDDIPPPDAEGPEFMDYPQCPPEIDPADCPLGKHAYPLGGAIEPYIETNVEDVCTDYSSEETTTVPASTHTFNGNCYFMIGDSKEIGGFVGPAFKSWPRIYITEKDYVQHSGGSLEDPEEYCEVFSERFEAKAGDDPSLYTSGPYDHTINETYDRTTWTSRYTALGVDTGPESHIPGGGWYEFATFNEIGGKTGYLFRSFPDGEWAKTYVSNASSPAVLNMFTSSRNANEAGISIGTTLIRKHEPDSYILPAQSPEGGFNNASTVNPMEVLMQRTIAKQAGNELTVDKMTAIMQANRGGTPADVRDGVKAATGHLVSSFAQASAVTKYDSPAEPEEGEVEEHIAHTRDLEESITEKALDEVDDDNGGESVSKAFTRDFENVKAFQDSFYTNVRQSTHMFSFTFPQYGGYGGWVITLPMMPSGEAGTISAMLYHASQIVRVLLLIGLWIVYFRRTFQMLGWFAT